MNTMQVNDLEDVIEAYETEKFIINEARPFDQYLREDFIQVYDDELNFIGYERVML